MNLCLGIDPGKNGGLAFVRHDGVLIHALPMPHDPWETTRIIKSFGADRCYLERAQAMPKQGVVSMFTYGAHWGQLQGILVALGVPYVLVTPMQWTPKMHCGAVGDTPKAKSLLAARMRWPKETWLAGEKSRKPHDGMIDAALIAEYGRVWHTNHRDPVAS